MPDTDAIAAPIAAAIALILGIALGYFFTKRKPEEPEEPKKDPDAWRVIKTRNVLGGKLKDRDVFHLTCEGVSYRARGCIFIADMQWFSEDGRKPPPNIKNALTAAVTLWRDALCNEGPLWDDKD